MRMLTANMVDRSSPITMKVMVIGVRPSCHLVRRSSLLDRNIKEKVGGVPLHDRRVIYLLEKYAEDSLLQTRKLLRNSVRKTPIACQTNWGC